MEKKMASVLITLSILVLLVLGIATTVTAQGVELSDGVVITAEVVAIDRIDREVTLLGPDGNIIEIEVGKKARNFDQIQIGDIVKVTYYESVAVYLGKRGEKPEISSGLVGARAKKGEKPGGVIVEAVDVSAQVQAIDKKKRVVTLQLPDGKKVTTKVDKSVKDFDILKVGDSGTCLLYGSNSDFSGKTLNCILCTT